VHDIALFVINNWDTITLLITNIAALFVHPPLRSKQ
jgi:hypothetical protein